MSFFNHLKPLAATIFILIISSNFVGFLPDISTELKFATYLCACIYCGYKGGVIQRFYMFFLLYLAANLLICQPSSVFRTWERLSLFSIMFLSVSPLITNSRAIQFRWQSVRILLISIVILSTLSFFGFFLGINLFRRENIDTSDFISNVGWFSGFYSHSMLLGPMSAIASCFLLYLGLTTKNKWCYLAMIPTLGSVMFAASRTAFIAFIIAAFFLFYKYSNNRLNFIKIIVRISILLSATYPLWNSSLDRMSAKQEVFSDQGKFGTRTESWNQRLSEFASSPIIGVGFCSDSNVAVDRSDGKLEPGSSWLAIASMTGLVGLYFVITIFIRAFAIIRHNNSSRSILLMSFLVFFCIHMLGEGYIYAAGNPVCVLAWLVIGCCTDMKYQSNETSVF